MTITRSTDIRWDTLRLAHKDDPAMTMVIDDLETESNRHHRDFERISEICVDVIRKFGTMDDKDYGRYLLDQFRRVRHIVG